MKIGSSILMKKIYDLHSGLMSKIGAWATKGGIPVKINAKDPEYASTSSIKSVWSMLHTLKKKNLTMYPYGNWFEPGEQNFKEDKDLANEGTSFADRKTDFENWRVSLKNGFIILAKRSHSPIVPVYVTQAADGTWNIAFGEPQYAKKESDIETAKEYLQAMRKMKASLESSLSDQSKS